MKPTHPLKYPFTTATALALALAACGGGAGAAGGTTAARAVAAQYQGPVGSEDATAGKERFDTACGACHPGGQADLGPAIVSLGWEAGALRQQIREGSGRMRPVAVERLSDEDMEDVLAYLKTIGTVQ